jgi:hypothetical protein
MRQPESISPAKRRALKQDPDMYTEPKWLRCQISWSAWPGSLLRIGSLGTLYILDTLEILQTLNNLKTLETLETWKALNISGELGNLGNLEDPWKH